MKNKNKFFNITLVTSSILFVVCVVVIAFSYGDEIITHYRLKKLHNSSSQTSSGELANNPIDFDSLVDINNEIYAWIRVPNTNIDYPVAQSMTDDSYYLHHNIYGKYVFAGTIYTEMQNSCDFSDPNTVLYGHNMSKGYMFQNLFKFQDEEFFNQNRFFYIYTPGHVLTYEIFAAYQYDDRHILNSFDFSDKDVFEHYIDTAKNPTYMIKNVRQDVPVTVDDKIVTLSTCLGKEMIYRYLVQGVLIDDCPTK